MKKLLVLLPVLLFLLGCSRNLEVMRMNLYSLGMRGVTVYVVKETVSHKGKKQEEAFSLWKWIYVDPKEESQVKVVFENFSKAEKASFFLLRGKNVFPIRPRVRGDRAEIWIPDWTGEISVVVGSKVGIDKGIPPDSVWVGKITITEKEEYYGK